MKSKVRQETKMKTELTENEGEMVFLDFQFLSSGDPMWDLGSTILLNTNLSLDKSLLTSSLQCYYQTFYTKLDQLGATYPKESFETFIQRWVTLLFWRKK